MERIQQAVRRYAPDNIFMTYDLNRADLVLMHVTGDLNRTMRTVEQLGKKYAIIQYALRSTQKPDTRRWLPLWQGAELVWSYYDLAHYCFEDGVEPDFNFYCAPLGVESEVFYPKETEKRYVIATSGVSYLSESVRECLAAADTVKKTVFHVGPRINRRPGVVWANGMPDTLLARNLSACEWVSGLRRTEGFELPAVEGLFCGARPIFFDTYGYRKWFDGLADFIPESSRPDVIENLVRMFAGGARPVTADEIERAREIFCWKNIIGGLWERLN